MFYQLGLSITQSRKAIGKQRPGPLLLLFFFPLVVVMVMVVVIMVTTPSPILPVPMSIMPVLLLVALPAAQHQAHGPPVHLGAEGRAVDGEVWVGRGGDGGERREGVGGVGGGRLLAGW